MPVFFGSIQPAMLRRLIDMHAVDGIEMVFTVPIGSRRRRELDHFYAANRARLGAAIGGSDCHFGGHDLASAITEYDGDFKAAVLAGATRPKRLRHAGPAPAGVAVPSSGVARLPLRRLRGQL
jgi:hypothetical protein